MSVFCFFFCQWVSAGETLGYIMIIDITVPENMADSRKQVSMCMHEKKTNCLGFRVLVTLAHHLQAPLSVFYCYAGNQEKKSIMSFHYPIVSLVTHPLTKKPEDSGHMIECTVV